MPQFGFRTVAPRPASLAPARQVHCVPVLLASNNQADRCFFAGGFAGAQYFAVQTANLTEASSLLSHFVAPIVMYDPCFDDLDWRTALARLTGARTLPSVLLLTDAGIENRGAEAYPGPVDFLERPLDLPTVLAALDLAYVRWSLGFAGGRGLE